MNIGEEIRRLRKAYGWTVEQLALESDCTITQVSRIERGLTSPKMETVERLLGAMGMKLTITEKGDA